MPRRAAASALVAAAPRLLPLLLLAAVALVGVLPGAAAAVPEPQLSDSVLYKILYEEPNRYLQTLGNVSWAGAAKWWHLRWGVARLPSFCRLRQLGLILSMPTLPCLLLQISDTEGSLSRTFLSPAHRRAAGRVSSHGTSVAGGVHSLALCCAVLAPLSCCNQTMQD